MTSREFAIEVVRKLQAAGFVALWAGGCVRDELLGLVPADYDVASDARPEQVKLLFRRCVEIGVAFGVIEVIGPRGNDGEWLKVQVATFRTDVPVFESLDELEWRGPTPALAGLRRRLAVDH